MCGRIVGVQFNSMLELPIRPSEIEVVREQRLRERSMRFAQGAVQFKGFLGSSFGLRQTILGTGRSETREQDVGVRQPGIGKRVARILRHRLIEVVDRFAQIYSRSLVPKKSAFQIELLVLGILRWFFSYTSFFQSGKLCTQCVGNGLRNLTLHRKDVGELAIVSLGREMRIVGRID